MLEVCESSLSSYSQQHIFHMRGLIKLIYGPVTYLCESTCKGEIIPVFHYMMVTFILFGHK